MKKTILIFGLISGVLSSAMMIGSLPLMNKLNHGGLAYLYGYTTIVLSFLLVYFGIRSYRDNLGAGAITFGRAFTVGICITLISCVFYVVTWDIVYFKFMPDFMTSYTAHAIQQARASNLSPADLQAKIDQLNHTQQLYRNPFFMSAMTFREPFPVGLVITLISSAILRRKPQSAVTAEPAAA
jgi:hypothetical protein